MKLFPTAILGLFHSALTGMSKTPEEEFLESQARKSIINLAENILRDSSQVLLEINEIANKLGLSRRTIHRAFVSELHVSPSVYIRRWRLARVHVDLRKRSPENVTNTAGKRGFSEIGRFSDYYRKMFGELPSQTLLHPR